MEKTYNPQDIEQPLYEHWEKQGYFKPNGDESQESFCIMIPPPNVTGSLHMGHAFQQTIMDTMIRYQRMQGKNTLWQVGTDHAGIATQMVVERKIAAEEGKTRHDYGREAFIDKIWEWKAESGGGRIGVRRAASGAFRGFVAGADLACGLSFRRSEDDLSTVILSVGGAFLAGCGGAGRIFPSENPFGITFARFGARDGSVGRPDRKNKLKTK